MTVNPQRGEVEVEIGGERRILRLSLNALAEAQELLGEKDFNAILARLGGDGTTGRADFVTLRALLTAGLRDGWPEATPQKVGRLIGPADLPRVMEAFNKAMEAAFPPASGASDPRPAAAGDSASLPTGPT